MYIERKIEKHLSYLAEHFPAVVVGGARQTGKTTLIRHLFGSRPDVRYVSLDHPPIRMMAKQDPELFLQHYTAPVIIDEIQYAPELFPYLKMHIDAHRAPGQFFLTGSQMFRLMKDVRESLAGRVGVLSLYGLSRSEILGAEEKPFLPSNPLHAKNAETVTTVFDKIYRGSMPQMSVDPGLTPDAFYGSYLQTYLERDIREIAEIRNETQFLQLISCAAARTGQELNYSDMARDVGIDRKTAESWIALLISSGLVYLLPAYSGNTIKRLTKRPKLYFMDTGLACYLSLWNNPRALEQSAMAGAMFETYVITDIIKQYANSGMDTRSRFAYYRDSNGREIDLLLMDNRTVYPVEIKKQADPGREALRNFGVLPSLSLDIGPGAVICLASELYPLDRNNLVVPVSML